MGRVKEIKLYVIDSKKANQFIREHHYSGKVAPASVLHFGAYLNNILHGVLSFGSPLVKRNVLNLVTPTLWNEMLELNRLAFDDYLPKNSESRCLSIAIKMIKKNAPHIKWILSFSDGTQCGDGTIYRAAGFVLTQIKQSNDELWQLPEHLHYLNSGKPTVHRMTINCKTSKISHWVFNKYNTYYVPLKKLAQENGGVMNTGFQLRYIYLIDKNCKINCPILSFNMIDIMGARMYKGKRPTIIDSDLANNQLVEGGASPTVGLYKKVSNV